MAQKKHADPTTKRKRPKQAPKRQTDPKSPHKFPGLRAMKAAGAVAIEVHFHGSGDDGWYDYRVMSLSKNPQLQLCDKAETEITAFLENHLEHYGEGPGSVLLARFDLLKSVCKGYSGEGDLRSRLSELLATLAAYGVKNIVGDLTSGVFSKCKVVPAASLSRKDASMHVQRFLELALDYAAEYREYEEAVGEDCKEYALLDDGKGNLRIDVPKRRVTWTRSPASKSVAIAVGKLAETILPLRLT